MSRLNYIIWSANPEIFPTIDWVQVRWYGLLFAMGFILGQQIMYRIYKVEGKPQKDVDTLTLYMIIFTILGARLGHVLFYEPMRYLRDPLSILKTWEGGLASHGGAIGILLGMWIYSNYLVDISPFKGRWIWKKRKREGQSFLYVMDRMVILAALTGALIRFGNFMNAEIIGLPTTTGYGVVFARDVIERLEDVPAIEHVALRKSFPSKPDSQGHVPVDLVIDFSNQVEGQPVAIRIIESQIKNLLAGYPYIRMHIMEPYEREMRYDFTSGPGRTLQATIRTMAIPRHPAQLYESISSALLFIFLLWLWSRKKERTPEGQIFGIFLIVLFSLRFFYEFLKENQVDFEEQLPLNMGQILSLPFIALGVAILIRIKSTTR